MHRSFALSLEMRGARIDVPSGKFTIISPSCPKEGWIKTILGKLRIVAGSYRGVPLSLLGPHSFSARSRFSSLVRRTIAHARSLFRGELHAWSPERVTKAELTDCVRIAILERKSNGVHISRYNHFKSFSVYAYLLKVFSCFISPKLATVTNQSCTAFYWENKQLRNSSRCILAWIITE